MELQKQPSVFVIVLNFNGYEDTARCVASLRKSTYANLTVVIVDNSSLDISPQKLRQDFPAVTLIQTDCNRGYAGGMNFGARYALEQGADYVLILNNDTAVEQDFLEPLVERAESAEHVGIVTPKVLYMETPHLLYAAGAEYNKWRCCGVNRCRMKSAAREGNDPTPVSMAQGAAMLVKRQVFEEMGFMSEKFFMYYEDLEFSLRIAEKYLIYYEPKSVIYHRSGAGTSWVDFSLLYHYYFTRNRLLFYASYPVVTRLYVLFYSMANVGAKALKLFYHAAKTGRKRHMRAVQQLLKGFRDGLHYLFKRRIAPDDRPVVK